MSDKLLSLRPQEHCSSGQDIPTRPRSCAPCQYRTRASPALMPCFMARWRARRHHHPAAISTRAAGSPKRSAGKRHLRCEKWRQANLRAVTSQQNWNWGGDKIGVLVPNSRRDCSRRTNQTLFGTVTVKAPRISICLCSNKMGFVDLSFSPLTKLVPDRYTPELRQSRLNWARDTHSGKAAAHPTSPGMHAIPRMARFTLQSHESG